MIDPLAEINERISHLQINADVYEAWKQNDVTRRLMLDLQYQILESALSRIGGLTQEELAISAIKRNEEKDCLDDVLSWKPQELIP